MIKTNYNFYPACALRALGLLLASGQTATYWKTETIQSYLMIWGTYDPIEWGPSDPKNGGYIYVGVGEA